VAGGGGGVSITVEAAGEGVYIAGRRRTLPRRTIKYNNIK